jgi:Trypsin-co-occurring domain 1
MIEPSETNVTITVGLRKEDLARKSHEAMISAIKMIRETAEKFHSNVNGMDNKSRPDQVEVSFGISFQ